MKELLITQSFTNREFTSFDKYLTEIGRYKLITPEEEVLLAELIKSGDEVALKKLVEANLRFVVSVAKQYQNRGLSLPDLVNEGNLGLMRAAQLFDNTRGFKFISYAVWWIRAAIKQALNKNSLLIRMPTNKIDSLSKIKKFTGSFAQENERDPNTNEIVDGLGLELSGVEKLVSCGKHLSLDAPINGSDEEDPVSLLDYLSGETEKDKTEEADLKKILKEAISKLPENEQKVIEMIFFQNPMSIKDIGLQLNLGVSQIENLMSKALSRLRKELKNLKPTLIEYY